jgi:hypothetical protein
MIFKGICWETVDWTHVAKDRNSCKYDKELGIVSMNGDAHVFSCITHCFSGSAC